MDDDLEGTAKGPEKPEVYRIAQLPVRGKPGMDRRMFVKATVAGAGAAAGYRRALPAHPARRDRRLGRTSPHRAPPRHDRPLRRRDAARDRPGQPRVTRALRSALAVDEHTEWAIETTARSLDADSMAALERLGFARIHVGVQSLQADARRILGRRGSAEMVLDRITACVARGWIVSADLLYGLPGQTADHVREDIARLASAGADGVSLYHLNHGSHNYPFMVRSGLVERGEECLFEDFQLFAQAAAYLESLGYARNHVTHFARGRDRSLYSRHALRGEDLLALGSSADGVFGARFYRHHELGGYLAESPSPAASRASGQVPGPMPRRSQAAAPSPPPRSAVQRIPPWPIAPGALPQPAPGSPERSPPRRGRSTIQLPPDRPRRYSAGRAHPPRSRARRSPSRRYSAGPPQRARQCLRA